jgi:cephalosporin-C deacetylase
MTEQPADLALYWDSLDEELERFPARPELELIPMRSTHFCSVYWAKITSIGPYRIGGYLSIPHGDAPFPAIMQTPKYGSVNHVPDYNDRKRYVIFTLMHRGQRLTDQPWASAYPGLLTEGIADKDSYIYRSIVADCLRGAEFLQSRPEVDSSRIAISGDDLALITASRRPAFTHAQISGLLFHRLIEHRTKSSAYPVEEVNDFLRGHPDQEQGVADTLSYFDPIHHVGNMKARTLLSIGDDGAIGGPEWLTELSKQIGGPVEEYRVTHRGGTDNDAIDAWLANQLGTTAMSKFRPTMP